MVGAITYLIIISRLPMPRQAVEFYGPHPLPPVDIASSTLPVPPPVALTHTRNSSTLAYAVIVSYPTRKNQDKNVQTTQQKKTHNPINYAVLVGHPNYYHYYHYYHLEVFEKSLFRRRQRRNGRLGVQSPALDRNVPLRGSQTL